MMWIHADGEQHELRELFYITSADMQVDISASAGVQENSWQMTMPDSVWSQLPVQIGHMVYAPGTEWGGPVTQLKHHTGTKQVTVSGPTWRGLLHQRRIRPPTGEGYLVYTDTDAHELLRQIIGSSFGTLFRPPTEDEPCGVLCDASWRYQSYAAGLQQVLDSAGLRMQLVYDSSVPGTRVTAVPYNTLNGIELSQDYGIIMTSVTGNLETANHCLALGSGELADRMVLDVWRDGDTITTTQPASIAYEDIRTVLLDYSSAESEAELYKSAVERLLGAGPADGITINEIPTGITAELGDRIPVRDRLTGLQGTARVRRKILTIQQGSTKIDIDVDRVD